MNGFALDPQENLDASKKLIDVFEGLKEKLKPSANTFTEIMKETGSKPNIKVAEGYAEIVANYEERIDEILTSLYAMKEEAERILEATS